MSSIVTFQSNSWDTSDSVFHMRRVARMSTTAQSYWNNDRVCRYANRACLHWFHVDPELLVGLRLQDFIDVLELRLPPASFDIAYRGEPDMQMLTLRCGDRIREGLLHCLPDFQGDVVKGMLLEISATPVRPRFAGRAGSNLGT